MRTQGGKSQRLVLLWALLLVLVLMVLVLLLLRQLFSLRRRRRIRIREGVVIGRVGGIETQDSGRGRGHEGGERGGRLIFLSGAALVLWLYRGEARKGKREAG